MPGASGGNLADVSLVLAVPTSREDYDAIFAGQLLTDYRTTFGSESLEALWQSRFQRTVEYAQALIGLAREHGASVYVRAGKADLQRATRASRIVVFMAHWRGAVVGKADALANVNAFQARAAEPQQLPAIAALADAQDLRALRRHMNALIERGDFIDSLPPDLAAAARASRPLGFALSRDILDKAFEGLLRPGNQVEMFDGLHSATAIEAAIDPVFSGEFDLTMCNSVILATLLDMRRGGAIQHVHWPKLVDPLPQYVMIVDALRHRAANPAQSYISIRQTRHGALKAGNTDVYRQHSRELLHSAWRTVRGSLARWAPRGT